MQKYDLIIEPKKNNGKYFKELYEYRELLYVLTWRDIKVRYKQAAIGALWAIIRPIITMIVFTIVFGKIAKLPSEKNVPYAIMVYSALLPWQFFSNGFTACANSLVTSSGMLSKIYFPRLILPVSSILTAMVDFVISFIIFVLLMVYYKYLPSSNIIFLPLFIILTFVTVFAFGVMIAALNVEYRDFRYIIPFLLQLGLYISPVGFSSSIVPEKYKVAYNLNPMVGIIDGFRWCILGSDVLNIKSIFTSTIVLLTVLIVSVKIFRRLERTFADKI
ncbi:transport permease protein [Propionigenium maris DSM 9537]|uniref:Transport permease protein n=1 Tax=Propionigenium maris DSM 9537 TaxID=1123000 RepID=A0A9W6LNN9_9FUSO|nr:ABC transporter permease [Propionigenium maris]GLI56792.1 transport permease protein [Propionigenium maris DSM 9537]